MTSSSHAYTGRRAASTVAATLAFVATAASAATPGAAPAHTRGTISAVTASSVDVRTANGGVVHFTTSGTRFVVVAPATRAAITPDTFVGIATDGEAPGARAREVVVFPNSMRGAGEGHYAWDLPQGGSAMTNGTVAAPSSMTNGTVAAHSAMTNGTVASMGANGPLVVTVAYKGGSRRITVPANAPIVRSSPGTHGDLHVGTHVFVVSAGGKALTVIAGSGTTVPPM